MARNTGICFHIKYSLSDLWPKGNLLVMSDSYSKILKVPEYYTILGHYCVSRMDEQGNGA